MVLNIANMHKNRVSKIEKMSREKMQIPVTLHLKRMTWRISFWITAIFDQIHRMIMKKRMHPENKCTSIKSKTRCPEIPDTGYGQIFLSGRRMPMSTGPK